MDRIAVNLASDVESDTRFRPALVVNAAAARAQAAAESAPVELWPFLAFAAAVLLLLEWIVYCLRVRG
jgi:dTDP-4-dehydrorhamnose reductase